MPGHGLTWRASSGKSLRSGWPSNSVGQVEVAQAGVARRSRCRTSPRPHARASRHRRRPRSTTRPSGSSSPQVGLEGDAPRRAGIVDVGDPGEDLEAGVAAGVAGLEGALGRLVGGLAGQSAVDLGVHRAPEGRRHPVDDRQEGEVLGAQAVAGHVGGRRARPRWSTRTQRSLPGHDVRADDGVAEGLGRRGRAAPRGPRRPRPARSLRRRRRVRRWWCRQPSVTRRRSAHRVQRSAMSSFWMRSWSSTTPSSRASGRGGQPGT